MNCMYVQTCIHVKKDVMPVGKLGFRAGYNVLVTPYIHAQEERNPLAILTASSRVKPILISTAIGLLVTITSLQTAASGKPHLGRTSQQSHGVS